MIINDERRLAQEHHGNQTRVCLYVCVRVRACVLGHSGEDL